MRRPSVNPVLRRIEKDKGKDRFFPLSYGTKIAMSIFIPRRSREIDGRKKQYHIVVQSGRSRFCIGYMHVAKIAFSQFQRDELLSEMVTAATSV